MTAVDGIRADVSRMTTPLYSEQQLDTLRDQISGVSIDEEATMMLKFQRAYEANAKFFSAINQTLDTLLQLVP